MLFCSFWITLNKRNLLIISHRYVTFPPTGVQLAAGEEGRCKGQHPSHGNRQDPLCAEQLPALSSAEGQRGQRCKTELCLSWCPSAKLSHLCAVNCLTFVLFMLRSKSISHTSWRERSLGGRASQRCFHLRSLLLLRSEYSGMELFQRLQFLQHLG